MMLNGRIDLVVRDYELDLQGIVNNAVYLNYLEHARHEFMKTHGINFHELHTQGWDPVVVHLDISYRQSLFADEKFYIITSVDQTSKLRFVFTQSIIKTETAGICVEAKTTATTLYQGRPRPCPFVMKALLGTLEDRKE